ncbi:MAG TPA: sugar ABC transporter ATP-binding protein [Vicinamibacterales bacterium]|nr:sugar ABC transporter ATP-binding protein [Vicinamibacterales bacterium]
MTQTLLLDAAGIAKTYAGVRALKGVSFDLRPGEVHALVGENGAGKSTLIKIITGAEKPDAGTLRVAGRDVPHMDPATSHALGIAAIYQQPALFPHLTVAENVALALESAGLWRTVNWRRRREAAASLLARIGSAIDPARTVDTLSMPEQQIVEIAKAIGVNARIVVMDEPTASLTSREVERLFQVIGRLREAQVGVIYISHRLEEIFAVADRITVLRDGLTVETRAVSDVERGELIRLMVGREIAAVFPKEPIEIGEPVLEVEGLTSAAAGIRNVSLTVHRGEILGIAGLVGSGRTELARTMFGLTPAEAGTIRLNGTPLRVASPADAIRAGIAYVPEDRRQHGVVLDMSIAANTSLANLDAVSRHGLIDRGRERAAAQEYVDRLRIKTPSVLADVGTLSGGNQQKVALARWLSTSPAVIILDEPTQGVDVGSKAEIHALMQMLAARGLAIIMISSELPEILGMSDRIAVMHRGTIRGVLDRAEATQSSILALALAQATTH